MDEILSYFALKYTSMSLPLMGKTRNSLRKVSPRKKGFTTYSNHKMIHAEKNYSVVEASNSLERFEQRIYVA